MPREGSDDRGLCWPQCVWFKCGKRVLQIRGRAIYCTWLNDDCAGPSCSFALCVRGKMLPDSRCGLIVRRLTTDTLRPEDFKVDVKLRGKVARRLGDEDDLV